jgi:hypothetical protein
MENFDDLMRHKYDTDDPAGRFEFREEYWEQALALIEAEEARRRRKMLLWWWFAGALVLGGCVAWWAFGRLGYTDAVGDKNAKPPASTMATDPRQTASNEPVATVPDAVSETPASQDRLIAAPVATHKNSSSIQSTNQPNGIPSHKTRKSTKGGSGNTALTNSGTIHPTTAAARNTAQNTSSNTAQNTSLNTAGNTTGNTPEITPATTNNSAAGTTLSAANGQAPTSKNGADAAAAIDSVATNPVQKPSDNPAIQKLLESLWLLPVPLKTVVSTNPAPLSQPAMVAAEDAAPTTEPVKNKRFSVELASAVLLSQASVDQRQVGFTSGLAARYKLRPRWSLTAGVNARFLPGNWVDTVGITVTDSVHYSFGFSRIRSERRSAGLLNLEIPIAAVWQFKAFEVEAGVAPGQLLYALDRFKQTQETSLEGLSTTKNRLERADMELLQRTYFNTFAGVAWRFSSNGSLTLRGNYRFGNISKATAEDAAIKAGLGIEAGLRFKLF